MFTLHPTRLLRSKESDRLYSKPMSSSAQKKACTAVSLRGRKGVKGTKKAPASHMLRFHGSISSEGCTETHTTWGLLQDRCPLKPNRSYPWARTNRSQTRQNTSQICYNTNKKPTTSLHLAWKEHRHSFLCDMALPLLGHHLICCSCGFWLSNRPESPKVWTSNVELISHNSVKFR